MSNVNTATGIRYGVISANSVPDLYDEITTNGESLNWRAHIAEAESRVAALLEELGASRAEREAKDIVSNLDWDGIEFDEQDYEYTDSDGNQFQLSHLGGAPLIWCIKTSSVVHCRSLCSPCVPNAGDLDSGIVSAEDGYECYGVPATYKVEQD